MAYPMGASKRGCRRVDFDRRLKLEFHGFKVTTGAGFLAYRELDDALECTEMAGDVFCDNRTGKNAWHGMTGQFRQSLFGRPWGYDDVDDADRLGRDPAMRWIVGGKAIGWLQRGWCFFAVGPVVRFPGIRMSSGECRLKPLVAQP